MADTSARMLQLLSLLQLHRHWPGSELANRLEVSERTVRRDIDRLRSLGYPVESLPGITGGYQLNAGASLPPMVFDEGEAIALAIGLRDVAHGSDPVTAEASLRALAKLTSLLPPAVQRQVDLMARVTEATPYVVRTATPDVAVLAIVAQSCQDEVRLRFAYNAADGAVSERYVEPYRLVTLRRRWYLVAFDLDRHDWRTFRIDRATAAVPSRNNFAARPLPADDLATYVEQRIRQLKTTIDVELVVAAPPEEVMKVLGGWADVTNGPRTQTSTVTMTIDSFEWPLLAIAKLDVPVQVVTPTSLNSYLERVGQRLRETSRQ
jgi:predicted DNA-binding transcriptional regulator YafY